jgi:co-chaperonin GroES (HSP10)
MLEMIGSKVLVTEATQESTSAGGIILQGAVSKAAKPGLVLAVGPEATHLKAGDRVFLKWPEAMPVDVDNKSAAIVDMAHILAVHNV